MYAVSSHLFNQKKEISSLVYILFVRNGIPFWGTQTLTLCKHCLAVTKKSLYYQRSFQHKPKI